MENQTESRITLLQQYADLPVQLKKALHGLSVNNYDLVREPNKWTIREIVHHLVDADRLVHTLVLVALGNSGCIYDQTWYKTDNSWATILKYQQRSVDLALAAFRASHQSLVELLKIIPDGWDCHIVLRREQYPQGSRVTVGQLIKSRIHHARHHIEQIIETRKVHKV
jgi:hypothetical protein